jgi:hypothetical protein
VSGRGGSGSFGSGRTADGAGVASEQTRDKTLQLQTDRQLHARRAPPTAGVASSGGRGRASSAAACPSLVAANAEILHHGPPAARVRARPSESVREADGGAEAWPQVHPGVVRGARAAAGQ